LLVFPISGRRILKSKVDIKVTYFDGLNGEYSNGYSNYPGNLWCPNPE